MVQKGKVFVLRVGKDIIGNSDGGTERDRTHTNETCVLVVPGHRENNPRKMTATGEERERNKFTKEGVPSRTLE